MISQFLVAAMYNSVLSTCTSIFHSIARFDYFLCSLELEAVRTTEGQRTYNLIVKYAFSAFTVFFIPFVKQ